MKNDTFDLIVAGGGFAGVAAAVSAARCGLRVLLLEKSNSLGGAAVNCLVNPFMAFRAGAFDKSGRFVPFSQGIFEEIVQSLQEFDGDTAIEGAVFNEEYLKIILNRLVLQSGVQILFHACLISAETETASVPPEQEQLGRTALKSVTVTAAAGTLRFYADYFIDATGDAALAYLSGFPCRLGRSGDHLCQPMTLCFRLANVDIPKYIETRGQINPLYNRFQKEGKIKNPREDVLIFENLIHGVLHFNTTRIVKLNPTDPFDLTQAELLAREQVLELFLFLKRNFECFRESQLAMTAPEIGIRESRMIEGEYLLTGSDLTERKRFPDTIALGNYDIDIHNPEGAGTSHHYFRDGEYYDIPYRSLIPRSSVNLLAAGRCISVDHEAQASIRVMPIVCCIGQAAGLAAALAARQQKPVGAVDAGELQELIVRQHGVVAVD